MKNLESKSRKDDVTRNAFKKLEGLHLPSFLKKVCAHMNLKESTIRSTHTYIDALITERRVTSHPSNRRYASVWQLRCVRARALNRLLHICTAADAKIRAEVAALGTTRLKTRLGNVGKVEDVDQCTSVADSGRGSSSVTANAVRAEATAKEG